MASISKDRGRWRVEIWLDGKRKRLGTFDTRREAEAVLAAATAQRSEEIGGLTLAAYGAQWLDRRELEGRHRSISTTRVNWTNHIANDPIANKLVRRIARADVSAWLRRTSEKKARRAKTVTSPKGTRMSVVKATRKRISRRTLANILGVLRVVLADAVEDGLLEVNPAKGVRLPRDAQGQRDIEYLSADEVERLLTSPDVPRAYRQIYTVAIYTGLRAGELWGLRWGDVELGSRAPSITVRRSRKNPPKNGKIRKVPLLPPAAEALRELQNETGGIGKRLVWPARDGGYRAMGYDAYFARARYDHYGDKYVPWRDRLELNPKCTFHDLRHTCAVHLLSGTWGVSLTLEEIKEWLGHGSVTTTEAYYARLAEGHLDRRAAELADAMRNKITAPQPPAPIPINRKRKPKK